MAARAYLSVLMAGLGGMGGGEEKRDLYKSLN
jgi:hypothetical protein